VFVYGEYSAGHVKPSLKCIPYEGLLMRTLSMSERCKSRRRDLAAVRLSHPDKAIATNWWSNLDVEVAFDLLTMCPQQERSS